ncbi:hypothetical protein K8I85_05270 [bacterium]|nr:hypothetical protein [bacterium]
MRSMLRHALAAAALMGGAVVCAAIGERAYFWYVGEDGFAETLTVFFFLGGFVYALRARAALSHNHETLLSYLFLVAVIGMAFLVGEEISWGQRFFHWSTPAALAEKNVQGETTLHNIDGVHQTIGFAQLLVGAYGTFLPFVVPRLGAGWLQRVLTAIVPPVRFMPYFLPLFVWRAIRLFVALPEENNYAITQINEVLECVLAVGLMLFFRHAWLTARAAGGGAARPAG